MLCNPKSQEQKDYAALLYDDNFENNFDAAIADTKIEANQLHNKCVYSDIDNRR